MNINQFLFLGQGMLEFDVLKILPFDSARKCMSVIVRQPVSGEIILYCKGADSAIFSRLAPSGKFYARSARGPEIFESGLIGYKARYQTGPII